MELTYFDVVALIDDLREENANLTARIAELEEKQRWRVVANGELPEEDGEYWVWFDDEFTGIKISGYCDYSKQNGWDNTERVTHWLPLPPNPESPNDTQTQAERKRFPEVYDETKWKENLIRVRELFADRFGDVDVEQFFQKIRSESYPGSTKGE